MRYDGETGLYWMRVRAYDPALGRFLQHDPLGRASSTWVDQPYVYGGNNPLLNVDPNGQWYIVEGGGNIIHPARMAHRLAEHPSSLRRGKSVKDASRSPDRGGGNEGEPNNALWVASSAKYNYTVFLGKREEDSKGWHYNFHVRYYRGEIERANWHLRPPERMNPPYPIVYQWYFYDNIAVNGRVQDAMVIQVKSWDPVLAPFAVMADGRKDFIQLASDFATDNPAGRGELLMLMSRASQIDEAFKWLTDQAFS